MPQRKYLVCTLLIQGLRLVLGVVCLNVSEYLKANQHKSSATLQLQESQEGKELTVRFDLELVSCSFLLLSSLRLLLLLGVSRAVGRARVSV